MVEVVRLKPSQPFPEGGHFLVITEVSRIGAFEYFIDPCPSLGAKIGEHLPEGGPGYACLATALKEAQALANQYGVKTIYVQDHSVYVRPFGAAMT